MTRYLIVEGADGTGTTTHADLLAVALRAEGIDARAFHHVAPRLGDVWRDALAYASQRAALVAAPPAEVVVCDRWHTSTFVEAEALAATCGIDEARAALSNAMLKLRRAEAGVLPPSALEVVLDAPDDVLDARLGARGESASKIDHARRSVYRWIARDLVRIDTARPVAEVTRELLELALAALR